MSEEKQKFFQFPLAILALGSTEQEKINTIIAHGTILAGYRREKAMGEESARDYLEGRTISSDEFDIDLWEHRAWALGKELTGYHTTSPNYSARLYSSAERFISTFGKTPFIRVASDLVQEVDSGRFQFRDFCVLCAVYAPIGDKQYAIVRRDRVRAGALGYSSGDVLFDEDGKLTMKGKQLLSKRPDKAEVLTVNQCRYTLEQLHTRKFFSRFQPYPNARKVYYSRSLSHEELAEKLVVKLEKKLSAATAQDAAQQLYREKAASLLKRLIRGESKESTGEPPDIHQTTTAGTTGEVTAGVTALIDSSSNKCSSNVFSPNECPSNKVASPVPSGSHLENPTREQFDHYLEEFSKGRPDHEVRAIELASIELWDDMQHGRFNGLWMGELFRRTTR